jgi:hypothetical protein
MKTKFASVAEAVGHYYSQGYEILESSTSRLSDGSTYRKVMFRPGDDQLLCPMIEIIKEGFLDVTVREME